MRVCVHSPQLMVCTTLPIHAHTQTLEAAQATAVAVLGAGPRVKGGATPLVWRSACDYCDKKWEERSGDTRERDRMERSDRWWQQRRARERDA